MAAADLSLAVIVKNEEELLGRLLTHHRNLYDEAVVVDTGSNDQSAQVARDLGARVIAEPWRDDFSAARNRALAACSGRWILILDCDETVAHKDFDAVRMACLACDRQAWVLPQWNYTDQAGAPDFLPLAPGGSALAAGAPGYIPAYSIRLIPNLPGLRYEGVVHETLEPAAEAMALQLGLLEVPVHHQGHLQGSLAAARRRALYGRLLRRKIRGQPDDPRTRRDLAVQLVQEGRKDLAARLLERTVAEAPGGRRFTEPVCCWGACCWSRGIRRARCFNSRPRCGKGRTGAGAGSMRRGSTRGWGIWAGPRSSCARAASSFPAIRSCATWKLKFLPVVSDNNQDSG